MTGDLSSLYVVCYVCEELGHVASRCKKILITVDRNEIIKKVNNEKQMTKFIYP